MVMISLASNKYSSMIHQQQGTHPGVIKGGGTDFGSFKIKALFKFGLY